MSLLYFTMLEVRLHMVIMFIQTVKKSQIPQAKSTSSICMISTELLLMAISVLYLHKTVQLTLHSTVQLHDIIIPSPRGLFIRGDIMFNRFNNYRELSAETKQYIRTEGYNTIITNMISSMFDLTEFSITEKYMLMDILLNHGLAYVEKKDSKFLILPAQYVGLPDENDIFPDRVIATGVFANKTITIDDDINNLTGNLFYCFPDRLAIYEIPRFAYQFAEIDTSLVNNIQFSRIAPLVSSPYDNIRKSYEEAVKKMMQGELINSITSINSVVEGTSKSVDKVDISDGDYSEKIQYLSMYHTQMISRLANLFGIQYNFISKQANITNDELNSNESFCAIYPLMMRDLLTECINETNAKQNTNIQISFSRAWKHLNKIDNDPVTEQSEQSEQFEGDVDEDTENIE